MKGSPNEPNFTCQRSLIKQHDDVKWPWYLRSGEVWMKWRPWNENITHFRMHKLKCCHHMFAFILNDSASLWLMNKVQIIHDYILSCYWIRFLIFILYIQYPVQTYTSYVLYEAKNKEAIHCYDTRGYDVLKISKRVTDDIFEERTLRLPLPQ